MRKRKKSANYFLFKLTIVLFLILWLVILFKKNDSILDGETDEKYQVAVLFEEAMDIPVYTDLIEEGNQARPGTKRIIKYIVIHETDNFASGVGASNHASFLKKNNTGYVSWHYTVDDKEIWRHVLDDEVAYHAGNSEGNEYGIGIELCVNEDGDFERTLKNAEKLVATLLHTYHLDITSIKTHHDFSGKDCPHKILNENRWDKFIHNVEKYYNEIK